MRKLIILPALLVGCSPATQQALVTQPPAAVAPQLRARFGYVDFQGGAGIRYLTRFVQNAAPICNEGLLYVYQCITADGKQYVSAQLPVSSPLLATSAPPFPDPNAGDFLQQYQAYVQETSTKLDGASAQEIARGWTHPAR